MKKSEEEKKPVVLVNRLRKKCSGCKALVKSKIDFTCALGVEVSYVTHGGNKLGAPTPVGKCYRPETAAELEKAHELVKRRDKNEGSGDTCTQK